MFIERVRCVFPPPASGAALLQRQVSGGGETVAPLEGPAGVPGYVEWQEKTERSKPALPEAG
jgi:hypothetical protein